MGRRALRAKRYSTPKIREERLSTAERQELQQKACYVGSAFHKKNPGDFGLDPPSRPHPDKTLCDEANVFSKEVAEKLLQDAIDGGLVSANPTVGNGFPKRLWVVDQYNRVFEAMYGGNYDYHGYPLRETDPLHDHVLNLLKKKT